MKTSKTKTAPRAIKPVPVNTVADIPRNLVMIKGEVCCRSTLERAWFPALADGTLVNLVPHEDIKATVARASLGRGLQENYTSLALLMEGLNKLLWSLTTSLRPDSAPANYADAEVAVAVLKKARKTQKIRK